MAPKFYMSDDVDWIDPQGKLTKDLWLTIHLVFLTALVAHKDVIDHVLHRPDVRSYIEKAKTLLVNFNNKKPSLEISKNLKEANESLRALYDNVKGADSDTSSLLTSLYFRLLGDVAKGVKDRFLGKKAFKEYFNDIQIVHDDDIFSLKALDILDYFWRRIKDVQGREFKDVLASEETSPKEEGKIHWYYENGEPYDDSSEEDDDDDWPYHLDDNDEEDWEDEEDEEDDLDAAVRLLAHYHDIIEQDKNLLPKMSVEVALAFHVINLRLCSLCLDSKLYSKYQKAVLKAVSSYKDGQNQKQQEFSLQGANGAFLRLSERVLELIEAEYEDDSEQSLNKDVFLLGGNHGLKFISDGMKKDGAINLLNGISLDSNNLYTSSVVKITADSFYVFGDELYLSLVDSLDPENDSGSPEWEEEEELDSEDHGNNGEVGYMFFKEMKEGVLLHLDLEKSIAAHVVIPNILILKLPKRFFTKYRNAANALVSAYLDADENKKIEKLRHKADQTLLSLHDSFDETIENWDQKKTKATRDDYILTNMAIDYCLLGIERAKHDTIENILKDLEFIEKEKLYFNSEARSIAVHNIEHAFDKLNSMRGKS